MDYNLNLKNIVITGANSGIGKAAAIQLAGFGAPRYPSLPFGRARVPGFGRD
jgi:hypothetical protein